MIGGDESKATAEIRKWNRYLEDYSWTACTDKVKNLELIGRPSEYTTINTTKVIKALEGDLMPEFSSDSNFVFGSENTPFLMEITDTMMVRFYPAPMMLQQKTGQQAVRLNQDEILFVGGTDTSMKLASSKIFKYSIPKCEVKLFGKLSSGRFYFAQTVFDVKNYN